MTAIRLSVALALLVAVAAAVAQEKKKGEADTRTVQGEVTTATDAPVNGAVVQLKNSKTLQIRSFITKENGLYYFSGLSRDIDYQLKAEYQGSASASKTLSSFDNRTEARINLKLEKRQ